MRIRISGKRALALAGALFFLAAGVHAQTQTNVTATVKDPLAIPYAFGTYSIQLIPTGTNPTVNGNSISGAFNGSTDANGSFNIALWPNASISPAGTTWQFTVCTNPGGVAAPLGTGNQCTPPTVVTIAGALQSLSTTLSAVAPKLTTITIGAGSVSSISGTAPIVATPNPITGVGTISCPTCSTGGISGTISTGQIAVASAPNTIGGSAALTFLAGFLQLTSSTGMDITDTSAGTGLTISISGGGTGTLSLKSDTASAGIALENDGTGGGAGITLNNTAGGGGTAIIDNTATGITIQSTGAGGVFMQANFGAGGVTVTTTGGTGPLALQTNVTGGLTINGSTGFSHASADYSAFTFTNGIVTAATPVTGTALVLKKGTNAGNYVAATSSFAAVDGTNLANTVTIPVGTNLVIQANGNMSPTGGTSTWYVALFDGASKLTEQTLTWTAAGASNSCPGTQNCGAESFSLSYLIVGDGASHTVQLEYATEAASNDTSGRILNSAGMFPTMVFTLR